MMYDLHFLPGFAIEALNNPGGVDGLVSFHARKAVIQEDHSVVNIVISAA
jgi:hypothetical protein